ncbi:MAG: 50S ribosomal protein L10 [Candidatus Diapherotrites archaeon]
MKIKKTTKATHVSEEKKEIVSELSKLIQSKKTILIASIKNIPGSQFQEIVKKLRQKAIVKVPKKNLIFKAIDSSKDEEVKKIKEKIGENFALLFSDIDCFELAMDLIKNKSPSKAKAGQIAPYDIEIPAGPTDLIPGPAISELGTLGIQIRIENGKITIKAPKIVSKEGTKITRSAADMMNKLGIKPFSIGFIPLTAFNNELKIFYPEMNLDPDKTLEDLKEAYGKALPFSVQIGYTTPETITFLIGKAGRHEKVIEDLQSQKSENKEPEIEKKEEEKTEENTSDNTPELNSEENK